MVRAQTTLAELGFQYRHQEAASSSFRISSALGFLEYLHSCAQPPCIQLKKKKKTKHLIFFKVYKWIWVVKKSSIKLHKANLNENIVFSLCMCLILQRVA